MLRQYPRLSSGYELLFPSVMRSPYGHSPFGARREFLDPFASQPTSAYYPTRRATFQPDPENDQDLPSSPPAAQPTGPIRIPIHFAGRPAPIFTPQPRQRASPHSSPSIRPAYSVAAQLPPSITPPLTPPPVTPLAVPYAVKQTSNEDRAESEDVIAKREKLRMQSRLQLYGLVERDVKGDGNCQFRALSDQVMGKQDNHEAVRSLIVDWLRHNPDYHIDANTCLKDFLQQEIFPTWKDYCDAMSLDCVWGDHITLIAAAEVFRAKIWILSSIDLPESSKMSPVTIIEPSNMKEEKCIFLGHWHERHYTSLVQEDDHIN